MVRVVLTDGDLAKASYALPREGGPSLTTTELPQDAAMQQVQAFLRDQLPVGKQQDEDPDPFGGYTKLVSCPLDQIDVMGSEEALFTYVFHNPTRWAEMIYPLSPPCLRTLLACSRTSVDAAYTVLWSAGRTTSRPGS